MPTIQQLVRKGRTVLVEKSKSPALDYTSREKATTCRNTQSYWYVVVV